MLSIRFPVNSNLSVVTFEGKSKVIQGSSTARGVGTPNSVLFKGQLYSDKLPEGPTQGVVT